MSGPPAAPQDVDGPPPPAVLADAGPLAAPQDVDGTPPAAVLADAGPLAAAQVHGLPSCRRTLPRGSRSRFHVLSV